MAALVALVGLRVCVSPAPGARNWVNDDWSSRPGCPGAQDGSHHDPFTVSGGIASLDNSFGHRRVWDLDDLRNGSATDARVQRSAPSGSRIGRVRGAWRYTQTNGHGSLGRAIPRFPDRNGSFGPWAFWHEPTSGSTQHIQVPDLRPADSGGAARALTWARRGRGRGAGWSAAGWGR